MEKLFITQLNYESIYIKQHRGICAKIIDSYTDKVGLVNLPAAFRQTKEAVAELLRYCIDNSSDDISNIISNHLIEGETIVVDGIEYKAKDLNKLIVF